MKSIQGILVVAAVLSLTACGVVVRRPADQHENRAYDVGGPITTVKVTTDAERIEVIGADTGPVRVQERLSFSSKERRPNPEHPVEGGVLSLRYKCPNGITIGHNACGVSYRVTVPRGTAVEVRTDSGSVRLTGLSGAVDARTDSGRIAAEDLSGGRLAMHTDSGAVSATGLRVTRLTARTDSGGVRLDWTGSPEQVTATTDSGSVRLKVPAGRYAVTATTDSGARRIGVVQDPASAHKVTVRTDSGSIMISP